MSVELLGKRTPMQGEGFGDNKRMKEEGKEVDQMAVRMVVQSRLSGGLIGKAGVIIKKLREESAAWIDVGDSIKGSVFRVITVKGEPGAVIKGLCMVAARMDELVIEYKAKQNEGVEAVEASPTGDSQAIILIPNGQVGCIIGKGGSVIKGFRDSSGAFVKMSDEPLEGSDEKTLTIKGTLDRVTQCIQEVGMQLRDNQDRATPRAPYMPRAPYADPMAGMAYGAGMQSYQQAPVAAYGGAPAAAYGAYQQAPAAPAYPGAGYTTNATAQAAYAAPDVGGTQTIMIPVPDMMIGTVIGKGGCNIKEIRSRSRAMIKINDMEQGETDRMVTITGTRQANEMAVALVYEKMNSYDPQYKQKQAGYAAAPPPGGAAVGLGAPAY